MMMKSLPNLTGPMPMWPRCVSLKISRIPIASLTCGSKIASDAIIRIVKIKKIQKVPNPVDSSTEPLLFCAIAINVEPSAGPPPSKFRAK